MHAPITSSAVPPNRPNRFIGPATMVTAAFIGPGTVTVCTLAGLHHGFDLLWALALSVLATMTLQEMAARLGWATQGGLGDAIRNSAHGWKRAVFFVIVVSAIVIGNAAYEAGNIGGAVLGVSAIARPVFAWPIVIGFIAFVILLVGRYGVIEKLMGALVLVMSICFLVTAVVLRPSVTNLLGGFIPQVPSNDALLTVVGLVGTTVVPYNLFLHASSVNEKWKTAVPLSAIRRETIVAIGIGGIISISIVVVSSAALHGTGTEVQSAADMARQLEPLLGRWATTLMALGLFAAGISSAITAPLAAAYAARELFDWPRERRHWRFRLVWMSILIMGVAFASLGIKPIAIIRFAQVANGILLPVVAVFLVVLANRQSVMGRHSNRLWQNIVGLVVILLTCILSFKALNAVFRII